MGIFVQLVINSLIAGSFYTLMVLGFNLTLSTARFFNFAHGSAAAVGGYTAFFLIDTAHFPLWGAVPVAILAGGSLAWILEKTIYLPLRRKKASNTILLIASLGAFTAIEALLSIVFKTESHTLSAAMPYNPTFIVLGGAVTLVQVLLGTTALVCSVLLILFLNRTRFGKTVKAVSDDEEVSRIVGINTDRVIGRVFFLSGALAALAGIFQGLDTTIEPTVGMLLLLSGIIACIVGGVGSTLGGVLGAYLLAFVENFGIWKIPGEWKGAIAFGLLIVFLVFRPYGIIKK